MNKIILDRKNNVVIIKGKKYLCVCGLPLAIPSMHGTYEELTTPSPDWVYEFNELRTSSQEEPIVMSDEDAETIKDFIQDVIVQTKANSITLLDHEKTYTNTS